MKALTICILLLLSIASPLWAQVGKIRELQQSLSSIRDSTQYVDVINRISLLFYEQNADSTLYYALQARQVAFRHDYDQGLADATNNLGVVFDIKGNIQLALRYYNDAYNQYVTLGDSSNIVQTLMNIGSVYNVSGRDDKAQTNFDRALALGDRIEHDSITALVIYNYMLLYPQKFSGNRRTMLIDRAYGIAKKYRDVRLELAIDQLRAGELIVGGQRVKGMIMMENTLNRALALELNYLSMDLLLDLGDYYLVEDRQKAIQFYIKALDLAEQKNYRMYARDVCKKLYDYYMAQRDNTDAFTYSQKLLRLYEEQVEIDRVSGIDYIEYAVKDQQLISERLKSKYSAQMLALAVAVCVLTLLVILVLWRNWKLSKKTNRVLTMQFRQLESTSDALEKSNQNYARLIKMVAHDLRNPIGGINALCSLLQDDDTSPEEAQQYVELIRESSTSCLHMISDLLQTDFDFKETELLKKLVDLPVFLDHAIALLTFRAAEKNQRLILAELSPITINADPDKLLRVLNNLIVNAIKFSPEGETIRVNVSPTNKGVTISIEDHGLGIPEEAIPKIFDPFTTSKRAGTAGEQAFGLGLYISKQIVEAHGGKIWLETEEGSGTTFHIFLPGEHVDTFSPAQAGI
ncbi:tetratricopeptide repeat-containing sensor histidine kinase [Dyadobacter sp. CY261]|uniref:ATP-binding protein n=1 Tax=Dyadobacter sp. CY261 TaxID=2907203 RepID=UPI001F1ABA15|nr:tetratricopeptide repeat-containing sensor histidine kinase [Dyadobacter sp. CY261]MCF0069391.1 tetratricopeptide repeat-containing sensor histidine kinase [Dyadobacter sp. CY261]